MARITTPAGPATTTRSSRRWASSITDSLSALKELVFDRGGLSLPRLVEILDADFTGQEPLRQRLLNKTHKYGNDDDYPTLDDADVPHALRGHRRAPNTKGGAYRLEMLPHLPRLLRRGLPRVPTAG